MFDQADLYWRLADVFEGGLPEKDSSVPWPGFGGWGDWQSKPPLGDVTLTLDETDAADWALLLNLWTRCGLVEWLAMKTR